MQPEDALGIVAQVAVTLAGFAGVVVVFRPEAVHRWSQLDRFRLRLLLDNSILPLGYALVAMLLLTIKPHPESIWRWCSGFTLLFQVTGAIGNIKMARSLDAADLASVNRRLFVPFIGFGAVMFVLQAWNTAILNAFWPFFAAIVAHLIAAIMQFARIVLIQPHSEVGDGNPKA